MILDYALPRNRIVRYLAHHLMKSHETKYYPESVKSDLEALLRKSGIETKDELPMVLGAGRLLKGIRKEEEP